MKQLKANNLAQATKELNGIREGLSATVDTDVKEENKNHYHLIMVRIIDKPGQANNDVKVNVQHYNAQAVQKIVKSFAFLGYTKVIILHDPTKKDNESSVVTEAKIKSFNTVQLKEFANENKIDLKGETNVDKVKDFVLSWFKSNK